MLVEVAFMSEEQQLLQFNRAEVLQLVEDPDLVQIQEFQILMLQEQTEDVR